MDYLFDTNIVIHMVRDGEKARVIENRLDLSGESGSFFIAAVSKGELFSLAKQYNWGIPKRERLTKILDTVNCIPLTGNSPLLEAYADIDAFSQAKHPDYPSPPGFTARNMGKNDLWIAATAFLLDVTLVTTDHDFDHLHPDFIHVMKI